MKKNATYDMKKTTNAYKILGGMPRNADMERPILR
jgi:hypothetical protein